MLLLERSKLLAEGAGAAATAALLVGATAPAPRGATAVVISGGNVDVGILVGLIARHETVAKRRLRVATRVSDRPGGLAEAAGDGRRGRRERARGAPCSRGRRAARRRDRHRDAAGDPWREPLRVRDRADGRRRSPRQDPRRQRRPLSQARSINASPDEAGVVGLRAGAIRAHTRTVPSTTHNPQRIIAPGRSPNYEFLMTIPSRMLATRSAASIASSSRSNRSFQRITTIGSMPPSNSDAIAARVILSPSFSSRLISTV